MSKLGRLTFPISMFAYPFYLWNRSPGKQGSHYDPKSSLFAPNEGHLVRSPADFGCAPGGGVRISLAS